MMDFLQKKRKYFYEIHKLLKLKLKNKKLVEISIYAGQFVRNRLLLSYKKSFASIFVLKTNKSQKKNKAKEKQELNDEKESSSNSSCFWWEA